MLGKSLLARLAQVARRCALSDDMNSPKVVELSVQCRLQGGPVHIVDPFLQVRMRWWIGVPVDAESEDFDGRRHVREEGSRERCNALPSVISRAYEDVF